MGRTTNKDLFQLTVDEIQKRQSTNNKQGYSSQISYNLAQGNYQSENLQMAATDNIISEVRNMLLFALPGKIIQGLHVSALTDTTIQIEAGVGTIVDKVYRLGTTISLDVPFNTSEVLYVTLLDDNISILTEPNFKAVIIARIIVPRPGVTAKIQDDKDLDNIYDAYIINLRTLQLHVDKNGKMEDDSIEVLRDNIGKILADNLIGNIRLTEDLIITNTQGTLGINSNSMKFYDTDVELMAEFNGKGVYFYRADGLELAKFAQDGARVGNIVLTPNALQSGNFSAGSTGFQIKDTGDAEFNDVTVRGTIYASLGEIGGWTIGTDSLYGTTTGTIKTGANVGAGQNGVILDYDGLRVYDAILGQVVNFPSDGSTPTISSGTIGGITFEINTNTVMRTSETVGDGSASSAGVLINNTGFYACEADQTLNEANVKILANGTASFKGEITATSGTIGGMTIADDTLTGGTIIGTTIRGAVIENAATTPRIRMDSDGLYYQVTELVGKYSEFKYDEGKYGAGVLAFLFNTDYPVLSIMAEYDKADIRFYNRSADPGSGTGPHELGDMIVVDGTLKICSIAGSPGTFTEVGSSIPSPSEIAFSASGFVATNVEDAIIEAAVCDITELWEQESGGTVQLIDYDNINFNQKQGLNFVVHNRTEDPASPVPGELWFRTDL